IDLKLNASRINISGAVQETATQTALQSLNSTGVKTFTIASQNWTAGNCTNRLRLEFEFTSGQDHGTALTVVFETNTTDSEVTTVITTDTACGPSINGLNTSGRGFLQFDNDHSTTLGVGDTTDSNNEPFLHIPVSSIYRGETLIPKIEVDPTGTGFSGTASHTGTAIIYDPASPANRRSHTVIYDSTRKRMILFGGIDRDGGQYNDVWELRLDTNFSDTAAQWKELSPTGTPPSARRTHIAEFDSTANRMIAGLGFDGSDKADWFELDFSGGADGAWAALTITADATPIADGDGVPDARAQPGSTIDNANKKMYIFAGFGATRFNDLWELDVTDGSEQWTELAEDGKSGSPSQRNDPSFEYDSTNTQLVVFGGYTGSARLNDVWFWNIGGSAFAEQTGITGSAPSIRELTASVYDDTNNRMIIWSGRNGTAVSDLRQDFFELDLTASSEAWTDRTGSNLPAFAWGTNGAAYDTSNKLMIIVGGLDKSLEETKHAFALDLSAGGAITLEQLWFNNYLRDRDAMAYAYDEDEDIMLSMGGYGRLTDGQFTADDFSGEDMNEIWLYSPSADEWFQPVKGTGLTMTNREGCVGIYDTNRNRFILFGGLTGNATSNNVYYNDTWELKVNVDKHYVLTKLAPTGTPPSARWLANVCYDRVNDRMIVFGGHDGAYQNDLFELDFSGAEAGAWTAMTPTGTPPTAKRQGYAIYDETNAQMVVWGGKISTTQATNETDFLDTSSQDGAWSDPAESGTPSARRGGIAVYDNNNGFMIIFGGTTESAVLNELQYLDLTSGSEAWTSLTPTTKPEARRSFVGGYDRTNKKLYIYGGREEANDAISFLNVNNTWELDASNATPTNWDWAQKFPNISISANIDVTGLSASTNYHWQTWATGSVTGDFTTKTSFGGNAESAADFITATSGTSFTQSLADSISFTISQKISPNPIKTESLIFTEAIATQSTFIKSLIEALTITTVVSLNFFANKTASFSISETSARAEGTEQPLSDSVTVAEVQVRTVGKNFAVNLTYTKAMKAEVVMSRTEALAFIELLTSDLSQPEQIIYDFILRLS
ncbi:MAG: kelch repeat-containing protein, partial [Patescibacteria group bacterium]|nr:kelch repeat-containing protein [Patescibacteria group bacterium]